MAVVAFDTHALVKEFKGSGFEEAQAEALSNALKKVQKSQLANLATKADHGQEIGQVRQEIGQVRQELKEEIKDLKFEMEKKFESMKGEINLLKWMVGAILAGVISLILKAFFV